MDITSPKSSKKTINRVTSLYYPKMKKLGLTLHALNAIPIIKDPDDIHVFRTSGNVGIKVDELPGFLITGTEVIKNNLKKKDLVYIENIDYRTQKIYAHGIVQPSREVLIHDQIIKTFQKIRVILHTHDNVILQFGTIPCTRKPSFSATLADAHEVVRLLHKNPCVNLKNHGQIIIGKTVEEALHNFIKNHLRALKNFRKIMSSSFA